jgi:hypothetical protein
MLIDDKKIMFVANVYGSEVDFAAAKKAAALFGKDLDKRGIRYTVATGKRLYP